jgi:hypothetical protein
VYAVATLGEDLYLGGITGADCTTGISRWNGTDWVGLGAGVNNDVHTLFPHDASLFAGGEFTRAGQTRSIALARWDPAPSPIAVRDFEAVSSPSEVVLSWVVSASGEAWTDPITIHRADERSGPFIDVATLAPTGMQSMRYEDRSVETGRAYWYALVLERPSGAVALAGPIYAAASASYVTRVAPLHDPGSDRPIRISYALGGHRARVTVAIYDVGGRSIRVLENDLRDPGQHEVIWDRTTETGKRAARGLYLVRLTSEGTSATGKLVLLH